METGTMVLHTIKNITGHSCRPGISEIFNPTYLEVFGSADLFPQDAMPIKIYTGKQKFWIFFDVSQFQDRTYTIM